MMTSEPYSLLLISNSARVLFTLRALAKAIAPLSPILFLDKFKFLRVTFFSRALAIRQAPRFPIILLDKSNWVRVLFFIKTLANDSAPASPTYLPEQPYLIKDSFESSASAMLPAQSSPPKMKTDFSTMSLFTIIYVCYYFKLYETCFLCKLL